jgi:hypothetical protein
MVTKVAEALARARSARWAGYARDELSAFPYRQVHVLDPRRPRLVRAGGKTVSCIDITSVATLEIVIDASGTKVWINAEGQCVARWYRIKNLVLNDERSNDTPDYGDSSA